ncbi:MAG: pyridoxal-phosphate dependent enzyme [Bacillota bacterium]
MYKMVLEAAKRLDGLAHKTPVATSRLLNQRTENKVYLKCENLQKIGAFKFRGAYNAICKMVERGETQRVLTFSSGNHAQAVAYAGSIFKLPTTVVMPENAPSAKLEATRSHGAEIITYNPERTTREELAQDLMKKGDYKLIHPYNNLDVITGQGTAAKELLEEYGDLDYLLVPCGGGGLLSGSAISSKHLAPNCKVIGIEPKEADDATKSFYSGIIHKVHNPNTIADGVRTPYLGDITFKIIKEYVDEMLTVTESEIIEAMYFVWTRMKLIVEPSGAVALAALFSNKSGFKNKKIGVIISGGNVDISKACRIFAELQAY